MESVWRSTVSLPKFESLQGDVSTDVLIIGGGITGVLCAYFLQERGIDYLLVEGNEICHGVARQYDGKNYGAAWINLCEDDKTRRTREDEAVSGGEPESGAKVCGNCIRYLL